MTENQLKYLNYQESMRHNAATEAIDTGTLEERVRSNRATEVEKNRANLAAEAETKRHNTTSEAETLRHNTVSEANDTLKATASLANAFASNVKAFTPLVGMLS